MIWLIDFVLQLRHGDVDVERLHTGIRQTGLGPSFAFALQLAADAHVRLPAWVAAGRMVSQPSRWVRLALQWVYRHRRTTVGGELLNCWCCQRWSGRGRLLAAFVFPRPAVLLQVFPRLPRGLTPLVYPLRLLQIIGRGLSEVSHAARRR